MMKKGVVLQTILTIVEIGVLMYSWVISSLAIINIGFILFMGVIVPMEIRGVKNLIGAILESLIGSLTN